MDQVQVALAILMLVHLKRRGPQKSSQHMLDKHSSELSVAFMTDASSNSAILFPNLDTRRRGNGHPIFSVRHFGVKHFKKT